MKENLTELVFILDKSGSMHGLEGDTIGGFNSMLDKQKAVKGDALVTTALFSDEYELLHDRTAIQGVKPLTAREYCVGGCTALLDAIGRTIDKVGAISKASVSAVAANRFTFAGFSAYTGTLTEPTGTTLGSAITALTDLRTFSIKIENNLTDDDFRSDGSGLMAQPTVLRRTITGQFEARNTAAIQAFRTTWIANGTTPLVVNFAAGTADVVQFVLPAIRLTNPPTPNADGNQPRVTNQFEVLSNGTSTQPMWCVVRTADTAL